MFSLFKKNKKEEKKEKAWPPLMPRTDVAFTTLAMSAHDELGKPDAATLDLGLKIGARTAATSLAELQRQQADKQDAFFYDIFPGEHYRLLAATATLLQPRLVVEIGTFTGMGTRVLADHAPAGARIVTFDIVPWDRFDSHLRREDFEGKCTQILSDLSDKANFDAHRDLLARADLIFLDAPKDLNFEWAFLQHLRSLQFSQECWMLVDDIKMWNMVGIWRRIASPKWDLTSFGHWCGTGLVHVSPRFELEVDAQHRAAAFEISSPLRDDG